MYARKVARVPTRARRVLDSMTAPERNALLRWSETLPLYPPTAQALVNKGVFDAPFELPNGDECTLTPLGHKVFALLEQMLQRQHPVSTSLRIDWYATLTRAA